MNFFFQFLKFLNLIEFYFKLILIFHYPAIFKFLKKLVKCCAEIQFEISFQSFKRFVVDVWRSRDLRLPASNCTPQLQSPRSLKRLCCIYIFIILIGLLFSRRLVICLSGRQKFKLKVTRWTQKKRPMTFRSVWLPLGSTDTRINVIGATFSAAVTWPAFGVSQLVLCVEFIFWPVRVSVSKHFSRVGQIATWTACATHMGQRPIIFRSQKKNQWIWKFVETKN